MTPYYQDDALTWGPMELRHIGPRDTDDTTPVRHDRWRGR